MSMVTQQNELLSRMEPVAANTSVDVLATGGMQQLAAVSTAISTRRIADMLEGLARVFHREGEFTNEDLIAMGIQP